MQTTITFKWHEQIGIRYPITTGDELIPLRHLAESLGVSYKSIVRSAARIPGIELQKKVVQAPDGGAPRLSVMLQACDLAALALLSKPRKTTRRFDQFRASYKSLAFLHPPKGTPAPSVAQARAAVLLRELEIAEQKNMNLRRQLANPGKELINSRWGAGTVLDEKKLVAIATRHKEGVNLKTIAFEVARQPSVIRDFLKGTYNSAAAQSFYKKFGIPMEPDFLTPGAGDQHQPETQ